MLRKRISTLKIGITALAISALVLPGMPSASAAKAHVKVRATAPSQASPASPGTKTCSAVAKGSLCISMGQQQATSMQELAKNNGDTVVATPAPGTVNPNAFTPDPSPSFPTWCSTGNYGGFANNRHSGCIVYKPITLTHLVNNAVTGTALLQYISYETVPTNTQTYDRTTSINMYAVTGDLVAGLAIFGYLNCSGDCSVTSHYPSAYTPLLLNRPVKDVNTVITHDVAPTVHTRSQFLQFTWNNVLYGQTTLPLWDLRCDNVSYFSTVVGTCIFPQAGTPYFFLSLTKDGVNNAAAFYNYAEQTLPNYPGANYTNLHGTPLTRMVDPARAAAQRAANCRGFVPNYSGDSCDEYPFAATYQGGVGAAVAHVPLTENSRAGSLLSAFYTNWRILDGENFWVAIVQ